MMRIHLALFGLSGLAVGFAIGLSGKNTWVIFPAIIQGYTAFHLWRELR